MTSILSGAGLDLSGMFAHASLHFNRAAARSSAASDTAAEKTDPRDAVRRAASDLVNALRGLRVTPQPVFATRYFGGLPVAAAFVHDIQLPDYLGTPSTLRTTEAINTQTDTSRTSSAAIGLDLSPEAPSVLRSAALGLDLTSPSRPSVLSSAAPLGIDLTSPEAPSVLSSSAPLGMDVTSPDAPSTITSTAEMNSSPTSLDDYDLTFGGGIHAQLSGGYTGTSTTLRVRLNGSTHISTSPSSVSADLLDDHNQVLASFSGSLSAGQSVSFGSTGVKVRFTSGISVLGGTSSTSHVSQTATTVDTNASFNAGWGKAPVFDDFQTVIAGSFKVNGTSITVRANDKISTVIKHINDDVAGVTASVSGDRVVITTDANTEDAISLTDDTSGFLAATKLATAATTPGNIRDDQQILSKTSQFWSVANGSFTVNGATISVDRSADTVSSIISRINGANAGVTAAYDSASDRVVLTTTSNTEDPIVVGSDTSGFLAAAKLATANTAPGNIRDDRQVLAKTTQFGSVVDGSFDVNGVSISVDRDTDTYVSVVSRINDANAGVTAAYDASADRIVLTGTTNSEDDIVVGNDTSGFLAAAQLDTSNTVRGNIPDDQQVLAKTSQFGGVASGSFTLNGATISVDRDADTFQTLVSRMNAAGAGVTAAYDVAGDRIVLTGMWASEDEIDVGDDSTGFLAAAGLAPENTERGNIPDDEQVLAKTTQFASVASGSFTVNGVSIAVDRTADTFDSIVDRINASAADVVASYDTSTDRLTVAPTIAGATLSLGNDTSGFLAAAGQASGAWGSHVNPDAAFDGPLASGPLFDPSESVHAGSFTVNGARIDVAANDSVESVLDKISASRARVIATYNDATQTISIATRAGSSAPIVFADDTSGFVAAAKLDHAVSLTVGEHRSTAIESSFSKLSPFAGVVAGTLTINGVGVAIDPASMTLRAFASALDAVDGVSASLDGTTLSVRATQPGAELDISSDTSGVWAALGGQLGTLGGASETGRRQMSVQTGTTMTSNAAGVAGTIAQTIDTLNSALRDARGSRIEDSLRVILGALTARGVGGLSLTKTGGQVKIQVDRTRLADSLANSRDGLANGFDGLLDVIRGQGLL